MTKEDLIRYAKRGIMEEIHDWKLKADAVRALRGTLSDTEIEGMLQGIQSSVEGLTHELQLFSSANVKTVLRTVIEN